MSRDIYSVLTAPLITEKATLVNEAGNQVIFRVRPEADKGMIKRAIETLFKVKVEKVHTIQYLGKQRRVGKSVGRRSAWKKAYVTLAEGNRIDFFEGA
jgi:large subunit ribosomal protein L23